jgi:hypothetical protein
MKKRNVNKKLVVSKETIANLNSGELKVIYGGIITFQNTLCRTRCVTDCTACG